MRIYECYGDRVVLSEHALGKGDRVELDEARAAWLMDNDVPIRPVADEPVAPVEVTENGTV